MEGIALHFHYNAYGNKTPDLQEQVLDFGT